MVYGLAIFAVADLIPVAGRCPNCRSTSSGTPRISQQSIRLAYCMSIGCPRRRKKRADPVAPASKFGGRGGDRNSMNATGRSLR
jgi:hypothetical protein